MPPCRASVLAAGRAGDPLQYKEVPYHIRKSLTKYEIPHYRRKYEIPYYTRKEHVVRQMYRQMLDHAL